MGTIRNDLTGRTFRSLTVLRRSPDRGTGRKPVVKWECICVCGAAVTVKSDSLLSGHTVSCGCGKRTHGFAHKERLYQTWKNMRQRCTNANRPDYHRYGGKGVIICDEWKGYEAFRSWALENGYDDSLTIDRIDSSGNYCPENCRWVGYKVQANNISRNRIIQYRGRDFTMSQLAEVLGLSYSALQHRIERGWSIERIAEQPQRVIA